MNKMGEERIETVGFEFNFVIFIDFNFSRHPCTKLQFPAEMVTLFRINNIFNLTSRPGRDT